MSYKYLLPAAFAAMVLLSTMGPLLARVNP